MIDQIRTVINNDQIVMLVNGQLTTSFPPEVARQIARALLSQAAIIENNRNPQKQIMDQAILMRAGFKLGLNSNKKLLDEASKEAQWNSELRRYIKASTASITSKEIFGTPTIKAN